MKRYGGRSSTALLLVVLALSVAMVAIAAFPLLNGRRPSLSGLALNLPVALAVATRSRFARPAVLVWSALPVLSLILYLVGAAARGSLLSRPGLMFFVLAAAVGLGIFVWAWRALAPVPNNSSKPTPLRSAA
jgi:hypothetical protein